MIVQTVESIKNHNLKKIFGFKNVSNSVESSEKSFSENSSKRKISNRIK